MSTINTFGNILHIRKDKLNKKGEAPIYLRVTINGKRAAIACKQFVLPEKWSSEAGKIKGTKEDIKVINDHLAKLKTKVSNIYQKLVENNNPISAAIVKEIFLGNQIPGKTLVQAFIIHNRMIEERVGVDYAEATHRRYVTTLMHTKDFLSSQYNKEDILLCDLNYEFIENFEHYFKTVRKCNHNSTVKYLKNFKKIIHLAIKKEWLDKDPFTSFETKVKETKRIYLTKEELEAIEIKVFEINRLDQIRDFFVFSCYTGYAYSDIKELTPNDIKTHFDGDKWIIRTRKKTDIQSNVPLLPKAEELIEKYKSHPESIRLNRLFPIPSNVKYNAYLKEVADLCNIKKNLSTHVARHTFATTVILGNGCTIESLAAMMAHKSIRTTQIYGKINDAKVSIDMKIVKDKFKK